MTATRTWLRSWLKGGLWFPIFVRAVQFSYQRFSIGNRFKLWLKEPGESKAPRGASELYQAVSMAIALTWLALLAFPPVAMARLGPGPKIAAAFAAYRVLEIFAFALNWVFVDGGTLQGVRRSLAGFIINLMEIAIYSAIVLVLLGCSGGASPWCVAYQQLGSTFGLGLSTTASSLPCRVVAHVELVVAGTVLSIVVASLVGGVLRNEVRRKGGAA